MSRNSSYRSNRALPLRYSLHKQFIIHSATSSHQISLTSQNQSNPSKKNLALKVTPAWLPSLLSAHGLIKSFFFSTLHTSQLILHLHFREKVRMLWKSCPRLIISVYPRFINNRRVSQKHERVFAVLCSWIKESYALSVEIPSFLMRLYFRSEASLVLAGITWRV